MAFGHWMERDVFPRAWDWCSYGRKRKEYTSERAVTHSKVVCVCVLSYSFIQKTRYFPGVSSRQCTPVDKLQGMNHIYNMRMTFPAPICTIPKRSQINRRN